MTTRLIYSLFLILVLSACGKDIQNLPPERVLFIQEVPIDGCNNHITYNLEDIDLKYVKDFYEWKNLFFFDANDTLHIRSEALDGNTLVKQGMHIQKFQIYGSEMLICAEEGIFSVAQDGVMTESTNMRCGDLEVTKDGEIIFSSVYTFKRLLKLEDDNSVSNYTDPHESNSNCLPFEDIIILDDNNIIVSTCDEYIIHFKDGHYFNSFGFEDMNLPSPPASGQFLITSHEDDLIVLAKNGVGFYEILKYTTEGEWTNLKSFLGGTTLSEKDRELFNASITDALVYNEKLYVSTTYSGCRGIQEYDVSINRSLKDEEYGVIQDPDLPSQCIEKLILHPDGALYILSSGSQITRLFCN